MGVANLLATLVAMRFLDRWGRRPMLLTASGGMTIVLAFLVLGVGSGSLPPWALLASILLYVGFSLTFLWLLKALGVAGTFAVFAMLSAFSFGFVLKCVPETRGESLEQMQDQWRA